MRLLMFLTLVLTLGFIVELYSFQSIKTITKNKSIRLLWLIIPIVIYINLIFGFLTTPATEGQTVQLQWALGGVIVNIITKLFIIIVLLKEDIYRITTRIIDKKSNNNIRGRRKFVSQLAIGIAAIPFSSFLYGIIKGRYNYKVIKYNLYFKELPKEFDGFKISHISDIHSGSFTNREKIEYGVDLINKQNSDIILFTGDIVNNKAVEMDEWIPIFKKLKAKYGKFSVLGNHDYGEYNKWNTQKEKEDNFKAIKDIHPKIGFKLLLNDSCYIEKNKQKIALIGVENWGKNFKQVGDLELASSRISKNDFKILMTHDPSHWEYVVKKDDFNYNLTLSGHTHGLQFGIEIPGFIKWSPAKYVYKQWAGLYKEFGRYINVNRGFGYHAFPGRVGIWPEITVIELKKEN